MFGVARPQLSLKEVLSWCGICESARLMPLGKSGRLWFLGPCTTKVKGSVGPKEGPPVCVDYPDRMWSSPVKVRKHMGIKALHEKIWTLMPLRVLSKACILEGRPQGAPEQEGACA